jgi:hypothetical protein
MQFVADAIAGASRLKFGHGTTPNDWKSIEPKPLFNALQTPISAAAQLAGPRKDNVAAAQLPA